MEMNLISSIPGYKLSFPGNKLSFPGNFYFLETTFLFPGTKRYFLDTNFVSRKRSVRNAIKRLPMVELEFIFTLDITKVFHLGLVKESSIFIYTVENIHDLAFYFKNIYNRYSILTSFFTGETEVIIPGTFVGLA